MEKESQQLMSPWFKVSFNKIVVWYKGKEDPKINTIFLQRLLSDSTIEKEDPTLISLLESLSDVGSYPNLFF